MDEDSEQADPVASIRDILRMKAWIPTSQLGETEYVHSIVLRERRRIIFELFSLPLDEWPTRLEALLRESIPLWAMKKQMPLLEPHIKAIRYVFEEKISSRTISSE